MWWPWLQHTYSISQAPKSWAAYARPHRDAVAGRPGRRIERGSEVAPGMRAGVPPYRRRRPREAGWELDLRTCTCCGW